MMHGQKTSKYTYGLDVKSQWSTFAVGTYSSFDKEFL